MRYLRFCRTISLVAFALIGISNKSLALDVSSKAQPLYGKDSSLDVSKTITISDNVLVTSSGWSVNNVKNLVTFKIDEFSNLMLPDSFSVTIIYQVDYKVWPSTTTQTKNDTLTLTYNKNNPYANKAVSVRPGVYYSNVTVVSITSNYGTIALSTFIRSLMLENEIQSSRYYTNFDCSANAVTSISKDTSYVSSDGELLIGWPAVIEADEYDLEWAVIDSAAIAQYYIAGTSTLDPIKIFENNATRVTLGADKINYKIPLIYEKNTILFTRIRSAQILDHNQRKEAIWSSSYSGGMERYDIIGGLEPTMDWQATTSFAEEGKRKSVVQFYDGSLRSRQTVTKDNVRNTTVVAETFYDYEGRPQIQVLPSPTLSSIIKYTPNFNPAVNGGEYDKDRYDKMLSDYCGKGADTMGVQSGAGKYYSPQNPDSLNGINKFIPDAHGYPFTETKYTQDGSGRVSEQGGVGAYHQLGQTFSADATSKDHQTKYFYGTADQEDLDALFGTEAGLASHYFKNMVRDANGQYSVSYTDMHGRTIATALAGTPALTKIQNISSNATRYETKNLLSGGNNLQTDKYTVQSMKSLLVTKASKHVFNYSLLGDSISLKDCSNQSLCYDCLYDLQITITDDCGNQRLPGGTPYVFTKSNFTLSDFLAHPDTTCNAVNNIIWSDSLYLTEGSYQVTKKLSVSKQAMDAYRTKIFLPHNTCKTEQQFIDSVKAVILSGISCTNTCQACTDSIGTWDNYRQKFMRKLNIANADSASYRDAAMQSYQNEIAECDALCEKGDLSSDILTQMLGDVSAPAGQYANDAAQAGSTAYSWSIFHTDFIDPTKLRYQSPLIDYIDEDGKPSLINGKKPNELSAEEFSDNFKDSWAKSLLSLHPEYNRYLRLLKFKNSVAWDKDFSGTETYADALAKGYLNPTGSTSSTFTAFDPVSTSLISRDPFYQISLDSFSVSNKTSMEDTILDISHGAVTDGLSMWSMATLSAKCNEEDLGCYNIYKLNSNAFGTSLCTGDLNMAWVAFRNEYISRKDKLMYQIVTQSPFRDIVPDVPNKDIPGDDTNHILRIMTPEDANTTVLQNGAGNGPVYLDSSNVQLAAQIDDACRGYATQWLTDLGTCNYTQPQKDSLIVKLIDVCKAGGDLEHPFGSSTVPSTSSHTPKSFDEVIQAFNIANGITNGIGCNADLITAPLPYDAQAFATATDEIITGSPDACLCDKLNSLHASYLSNNHGAATFAAYLDSTLNVKMSETDLNKLLSICGSSGTGTCNNLDTAIAIPPALQCLKDPCISCSQMQIYYNQWRVKYPGVLIQFNDSITNTQITINHLFENFMNRQTGFKKTAYEYSSFMNQCTINYTDTTAPVDCTVLQNLLDSFKLKYNDTAYHLPIPLSVGGCDTTTWHFPGTTFPTSNGTTFGMMFHDGIVSLPDSLYTDPLHADFQFGYVRPLCNLNNGIAYEARIQASNKPFGYIYNDIFWNLSYGSSGVWTVHLSPFPNGFIGRPGIGDTAITQLGSLNFADSFVILKVTYLGKRCSIFMNGKLLYSFLTPDVITSQTVILQFNANRGRIDWIRESDLLGNVILDEQFNSGCSGFAKPALQYTCRPDCRTAFTDYYNAAKGVSYTYSQIVALYSSCGINPDPCGAATINCPQLQNTLTAYNKYLYNIHIDSSGIDSSWHLTLNTTDTVHKVGKYVFKDFIHDGILSVPDSVIIKPGDFAYKQTNAMCLQKTFSSEWMVRLKPGATLSDLKLQFRFNFGALDSFRVEFNGTGTNSGFVGVIRDTSGAVSSSLTSWVSGMVGIQFQNWTKVKIVFNANNQIDCYINDTLRGSATYNAVLPLKSFDIAGWNNGAFQVDYVKMYDNFNALVYDEEFTDPGNFAVPPYAWNCNKPSDCSGAFTTYFNSVNNSDYTFSQIIALYKTVCNKDLDVCSTSLAPKLCGSIDTFPAFNPPTKCDLAVNGATDLGNLLYRAYQDSLSNTFDDLYLKKCMNVFGRESFTVTDSASEFHYTLYYYDQAGNLLKTVPPEGVNLSKMAYKIAWSDSVKAARAAGTVLTVQHTLQTQYRYNTLNQVVQQKTPDAGTSNFWYDRLGRLVISQNPRQVAFSPSSEINRRYSYTVYDNIGRITEVGEYINQASTAMSTTISRDTGSLKSWLSNIGYRTQVTATFYDLPNSNWLYLSSSQIPISGTNLRNRVAYTQYYAGGNPNGYSYDHATYYSYDIHGNVDTLIQDYANGLIKFNMMSTNGLNNRFKKFVYKYDLISGKVNHVAYQPQYISGGYLYRPADAMYHKYEYDAENRITAVYTSTDSIVWEKDGHYDYYKHGPLARTELGEQLVQGVDYAYTIQGWLKGVNSSSLTSSADMGNDGLTTNTATRNVARDAIGFSLNYFNADYRSINAAAGNAAMPAHSADAGISMGLNSSSYRPLYNGNISSMVVNINKLTIPDSTGTGTTSGAMLYNYQYDQLNRLVAMDAYKGLTAANNSWANIIALPHYQERVTYDGNGNILTYKRNGNKTSQQLMDDLTYAYNKDANGKLTNNRLRHVTDAVTNTSAYDESDAASGVSDIENQATDNYGYDAIGNLIKDTKENINVINWNVYGKITDINFAFVANKPKKITFGYDAGGNRMSKQVETYGATSGATTSSVYTWYVRDASGNVMAVYNGTGSGTTVPTAVNVGERDLYGSSRLGVLNLVADSKALPQAPASSAYRVNFIRGNKYYELSNHLGNVLSTVSDKKIAVDDGTYDTLGVKLNNTPDGKIDYYTADVVTANDYYPFGMLQPGRKFSSQSGYRYGFNGKENDKDEKGDGNQLDYGMRMYDPRLGKFLSVDPLTAKYPWISVYAYAENDVIRGIDLDGLEKVIVNTVSFAPFDYFGSDPWGTYAGSGNNRKFGDKIGSTVVNNTTLENYKIRSEAAIDLTNMKETSHKAVGSTSHYFSFAPGPFTLPLRNSKTAYSSASFQGEFYSGSSPGYEGVNLGLDYHLKGGNAAAPFGAGADIDINAKINFWKTGVIGEVGVNGTITGDRFPAAETYLVDEKNNKLFLGVSGINSENADNAPYSQLPGDNKLMMSNFYFTILLNKDNTFKGVRTPSGKEFSLEEWNKLFVNLDPKSSKTGTSVGESTSAKDDFKGTTTEQ